MDNDSKKKGSTEKGAGKYPGVAIDVADDEKTTERLVKERTCTQNNNPRNND